MRIFVALVVFVVVAAFAGCAPPDAQRPDVEVAWEIAPDPPRVGNATVAVALSDSTGASIEEADVSLEATMSHPGMQPVLSDAREVSPGRYEAVMNLTMGGDWIIILQATLPDDSHLRREYELPGVESE